MNTSMKSCMAEWKNKHPFGRSKRKLSAVRAQQQAVAACLQKTNESVTFFSFLIEASVLQTREYISKLPLYRELLKHPQSKASAFELARSFNQEFPEGADFRVQAYIADEFDDLYRKIFGKSGSNVGDWEAEAKYQARRQQDHDLERAMDKWERTTGMNAETGRDVKRDRLGRVQHGARSGMEFRPEIKAARAARDLRAYGDDRPEIAKRAASDPKGEAAYYGGESKASIVARIVAEMIDTHKPAVIKQRIMDELDMSPAGANTYFYKYKKLVKNSQ